MNTHILNTVNKDLVQPNFVMLRIVQGSTANHYLSYIDADDPTNILVEKNNPTSWSGLCLGTLCLDLNFSLTI